MASLDFPSNPTNGQTYALNGVTYYYNSSIGAWLTQLTSMNLSTSSNTQVLFNDAGLANGSSGLVFDKGTNALTSLGSIKSTSSTGFVAQNSTTTGSNALRIINNSGSFYFGTENSAGTDYSLPAYSTFLYSNYSSPMCFVNNGAERMRITAGGLVGINQTGPQGIFHVTAQSINASAPTLGWPVYNAESDGNSRQIWFDTAGNGANATSGFGATVSLVFGSYYDSRVVLTPIGAGGGSPSDSGTGNGKDIMIKGGTADNTNGRTGGRLYLSGGSGYATSPGFNTNYGPVIIQPLGGNVGIGLSPTTRNNTRLQLIDGIGFPATQVASSDANTLDDYEEGTWTPTITASSGTVTSYTASGTYTKIGRVVQVNFLISITNAGTAAGAYLQYAGLPFTNTNSSKPIGVCRENSVNGHLMQVLADQNLTTGNIVKYDNTGTIVNGGNYHCSLIFYT